MSLCVCDSASVQGGWSLKSSCTHVICLRCEIASARHFLGPFTARTVSGAEKTGQGSTEEWCRQPCSDVGAWRGWLLLCPCQIPQDATHFHTLVPHHSSRQVRRRCLPTHCLNVLLPCIGFWRTARRHNSGMHPPLLSSLSSSPVFGTARRASHPEALSAPCRLTL